MAEIGQSQTQWKSPEIRLADCPSRSGDELHWHGSRALYGGQNAKAFQERIVTLPAPSAASSEQEARRYAYDFFSAACYTDAVYTPTAHPFIATAFEPLGRHHLPLLLDECGGLKQSFRRDTKSEVARLVLPSSPTKPVCSQSKAGSSFPSLGKEQFVGGVSPIIESRPRPDHRSKHR